MATKMTAAERKVERRKHLAETQRLIDQAFALDAEHPYFGQTVEEDEAEEDVKKHLGPGPHPSGSEQAVHGSGGGGSASADEAPMRELVGKLDAPDGGFSVHPVTKQAPTGGYMVSVYPDRSKVVAVAEVSAPVLAQYLVDNADLFALPSRYFGAWHDPETHKVWLDISVHTDSEAEARTLAQTHKQIAYFDLGQGKSVTVDQAAKEEVHAKSAVASRSPAHAGGDRGAGEDVDGAGADPGGDRGDEADPRLAFADAVLKWEEAAHPRAPAGSPSGGEFTSGGGGGGGTATAEEAPTPKPKRQGRGKVFYHGSGDDHIKGVLAKGLDPAFGRGLDAGWGFPSTGNVYVSKTPIGAMKFALLHALSEHAAAAQAAGLGEVPSWAQGNAKATAALFKVTIPADQVKFLKEDPRSEEGYTAYEFKGGPIPATWIKGAWKLPPAVLAQSIMKVDDDDDPALDLTKWQKVKAAPPETGPLTLYVVHLIDGEDDEDEEEIDPEETAKHWDAFIAKWNADQPRAPAGSSDGGQWTSEGGSSGLGGVEGVEGRIDEPDAPFYRVTTVEEAYARLTQNQKVILAKPRMVSTLLDKLAAEATKAEQAGVQAAVINLCNVSVEGSNIFCVDNVGYSRIEMPQLAGVPLPGSKADGLPKNKAGYVELEQMFHTYLEHTLGIEVTEDTIQAKHLKASQNELDGKKVAAIMKAMEAGKVRPYPIFVTEDDYVVDGHHRWAAKLGKDLRSGLDLDAPMPVSTIHAPILKVLALANAFAHDMGIPPAGLAKSSPSTTI